MEPASHLNFFKNNQTSYVVEKLRSQQVFIGGKQLRVSMCRHIGKILDVAPLQTSFIAQCAEYIHLATLIHDDVVDKSHLRRGVPTLHQKIPASLAVLSGDYILSEVIRQLSQRNDIRLLQGLSTTLQEIVEAEFIQLDLKNQTDISKSDLTRVARYKTGSLLSWCLESLCQCSKIWQSQEHLEEACALFKEFGYKLGHSYQLIDDSLDFRKNQDKPFAQDLKHGQMNFVILKLIELYPQLYYPIQQIRMDSNTERKVEVWNSDQLSRAIEEVHREACQCYQESFQDINHFFKKYAYTISTKDFLEFVENMIHRTK